MLVAKPHPTAPAGPEAIKAPLRRSVEASGSTVAQDALVLTRPAPATAAPAPMNPYEVGVKKTAVVGTIAGGMALTTYAAFAIAAGMGPVGLTVIGAGLLANAAMGLLAWHVLKTPLTT